MHMRPRQQEALRSTHTSVLCVGSDDNLLRTRELLVQEITATVVQADNYEEACGAALRHSFSAAIIGYAFRPQEQERIRRALCAVQGTMTILKLDEEEISPSVIAAFIYGLEVGAGASRRLAGD